jgi:hypothetical protein
MKITLKKIFMDTSKLNGKRKFCVIFYIFIIGLTFNILWIGYSTFTDKFLTLLGMDSVKIRDFIGPYGYIIIISVLMFTIGYYLFTKKKIYGFEWIIVLSIVLLLIVPIYYISTHNWGVRP